MVCRHIFAHRVAQHKYGSMYVCEAGMGDIFLPLRLKEY